MPLIDGLASHYKLVESNLASRQDAQGNISLLANGVGVANTYTAQIDRAAYFQESAYLEAPFPEDHSYAGEFTISAWLRPENTTGQRIVIDKANDQFGREYRVDIYQNRLHFRIWHGGVLYTVQDPTFIAPNQWYHVVCGVVSDGIWITVNGEPHTFQEAPGGADQPAAPAKFAIGSKSELPTTYNQLKFRGQVDEVSIWDRELSLADAQLLYNNGSALPFAQYATVGDDVGPPPPPPSGSIVLDDFESEYIDSDALVVRVVDQFTSMSEVLSPAQAEALRDFLNGFLDA